MFAYQSLLSINDTNYVPRYQRRHLCSRLQSMQIVGHIFGSNIHLEIVQRSTDVLVFLVQTKVFTIGDLDLIWASVGVSCGSHNRQQERGNHQACQEITLCFTCQSQGNQHRSIVYGVYQVLSDLSSKLPQEYLRHLFNKLQTAPLENWDQQLVDLARSMFLSMVQRAKYNPVRTQDHMYSCNAI